MLEIFDIAWDFRGRLETRPHTDSIVLHHRAGSGDAMSLHASHLKDGWQGIGYHFYVRRDGTVYRGRPIDAVGAHTSGHNGHTVGICFEGNFEKEAMGEAQQKAGAALIAHIQQGYGGRLSVFGHRDLSATACPGKNFPFQAVTKRANALCIADTMAKDGIITKENLDNWRAFLTGDAPCMPEYITAVIGRYQTMKQGGMKKYVSEKKLMGRGAH